MVLLAPLKNQEIAQLWSLNTPKFEGISWRAKPADTKQQGN